MISKLCEVGDWPRAGALPGRLLIYSMVAIPVHWRCSSSAGRLGVPEDIVGPVVFLASHASDYVTGTDIICDGGGTQV